MPSDLVPMSTTTCVEVSFSTVPLMTRSSPTASSVSVVKFSSAEAKSSLACLSSTGAGCGASSLEAAESAVAAPVATGAGSCSVKLCSVEVSSAAVGSASVTTAVAELELWAVVSSNKVMPLCCASHSVREDTGLVSGLLDESFGCGGLTLASELGQSQLPDVLQKPASKGNSSTIATPNKQCQT